MTLRSARFALALAVSVPLLAWGGSEGQEPPFPAAYDALTPQAQAYVRRANIVVATLPPPYERLCLGGSGTNFAANTITLGCERDALLEYLNYATVHWLLEMDGLFEGFALSTLWAMHRYAYVPAVWESYGIAPPPDYATFKADWGRYFAPMVDEHSLTGTGGTCTPWGVMFLRRCGA